MADELKPCPFCGGKARVMERPQAGKDTGFFCAISCFCDGYSARAHQHAIGETEDVARAEATAAWNTRAAAMSDLIAGDADLYDTPSARITGDKDRENPVEGARHKPAVTQADVELAEEIGQTMASYYEWGRPSDYQLAKESAAMARGLIARQVEREIVAWLRDVAATYDRIDDGLSGLDKMSQGITEAADAIEQGQYRSAPG